MPRTTAAAAIRIPPSPMPYEVVQDVVGVSAELYRVSPSKAGADPLIGTWNVVACCAAVLLTILLTACGTTGPPAGEGQEPATSEAAAPPETVPTQEPSAEPDPGAPRTEGIGGTEEAAPTQDAGVSIELAGLPVGGFAEVDVNDPFLRCVHVNWTGPVDLPAGVNLELTAIDLQPAGYYETTDFGCPGDLPGCLYAPGVLEDPGQCDVAVRQLVPSADGFGSLGLAAGRVWCTAQEAWLCTDFQAQLAAAGEPERVEWDDAVVAQPEPDTGTSTEGTDSSTSTQGG